MSVTAASATALSASNIPAPVAVSDTAANIATYLDKLQALAAAGKIISITITGATTLTITAAQLANDATAMLLIVNAGWTIAVSTAATVAQITGANSSLVARLTAAVAVSDSASDVANNLDALQARTASVASITLTGATMVLSITAARLISDATTLLKIAGSYGITLTETVTAAQALAANSTLAAKLTTGFAVSDTTANVVANLDALHAKDASIASIVLTGTALTVSVTAAQLIADATTLLKITGSYSIALTGPASAAQVTGVNSILASKLTSGIAVVDTAANIAANLDGLQTAGAPIASVTLTGTSPVLSMTATQLIIDAPTLGKITGSYAITVTGTANAAQVTGAASTLIAKLTAGFAVADSSAQISASLDTLQARVASIASITLVDTGPVVAVTSTQFIADAAVLETIAGSYGIAMTGTLTAAQATTANAGLVAKLTAGIAVSDSSADVVSHLDTLQTLGASIGSIVLTDTGPVLSITAAQLLADAATLLKVSSTYSIAVTGTATAAQVLGASATLIAKLTSGFAVSDTSAAVGGNLDALQARTASIVSIALSDASPVLSITAAQLIADATTLLKITGVFGITPSGTATAAQVAGASSALIADMVAGFAISDSAAQISTNLDALQARLTSIASIALTDTAPVLTITATQLIADATTLLLISSSFGIALTGTVTAAQAINANALLIAKLTGAFTVSDTATQVVTDLDALQARTASIASITLTGTALALPITAAQLIADAPTLLKIGGSYSITLTGTASAAQVTSANSILVTRLTAGFAVSDSSSLVAAALDGLQARTALFSSITLTDATPVISITALQLNSDATTLLKIIGSFGITLTGTAIAAQVTGANSTLVAKLTSGFVVSDAAAQISAGLDALQARAASIASITLTDTSPIVSVTPAQFIADTAVLLKISGSYGLALTGTVTAAQAIAASATLIAHLTSGLAVSDSSAQVAANLDGLQARTTTIASIALTDASPVLSITAGQLIADATTLEKIAGSFGISLTGNATAAQVIGANSILVGKLTAGFAVSDSSGQIAADLDGLQARAASIVSIALTDSTPVLAITAGQLVADAATLMKIAGSYGIALTGTATAVQATGASSILLANLTSGFEVSDSATQVAANLDALQTRAASVASIALTGTSPVLSITAVQLISDGSVLLKIVGGYAIALTGTATAVQVTGASNALAANLVSGFLVSDAASQVASHLDGLESRAGSIASIALTDTTPVLSITATQLIADVTVLLKITGSYGIALTGTATAAQVTGASSTLIANLTTAFVVSDTSAQVVANLDALQARASSITSITLTDSAPVLSITAAQLIADAPVLLKTTGSFGIALTGSAPLLALSIAQFSADMPLLLKITNSYAMTLSGTATAAQAAQFAGFSAHFASSGFSLIVSDTAANLAALAGVPANLAVVNGFASLVSLNADATVSVASALNLVGFSTFSLASHHLTISDTAADLLAASAAPAIALSAAQQLSQPATVTVATAVALLALPAFSTAGWPLLIADTPAHLASLPQNVVALTTAETVVAMSAGNVADYTISVAQLTSVLALANLSVIDFTGTVTLADTAAALANEAGVFAAVANGSFLSHVVTALSANAIVSTTTATTLAGLPGFALNGFALAVEDTAAALLSVGAVAGEAIATSVGLSASTVVGAATATELVGLSNFTTNDHAFIVLDTPAALAALPPSVIALATFVRIASLTTATAAGYSISTAQFIALANLPLVSFSGFSGTITVSDTGLNLASLAAEINSAAIGSPLKLARGAIVTSLSMDATVNAMQLTGIATLPLFSLNGHALTLQDTPSALLAAFPSGVPDATAVILAANTTAWVMSAGNAAALAAMPNFGVGTAGITVVDSAAHILLAANAAGIADAASINLSASTSVTVAAAQALAGLANFHLNGQQLTITDTAANLIGLNPAATALASAIQLQGPDVVSVASFVILRGLPGFSDNSFPLIVSDTATNLLNLVGSSVALASEVLLSSNASLSAQQAEQLTTLANFSAGSAHLTVADTAADLLQTTGSGPLPDDWAGELAATSVTLSANAIVSAYQADQLATLGIRFSTGTFGLTISDTAAHLLAVANAPGRALATAMTLVGSEMALSAASATRLASLPAFSKGGYTITVVDSAANLLFASYATGIALADHLQLGSSAVLSVAAAESLLSMPAYQASQTASVVIADTFVNLLTLGSGAFAALQSTPIELSADASVSVAQLAALAALPQYQLAGHSFSLNGHALTVFDTAVHIAAYTPDTIVTPTAYVISGDGTVSALQADHLATDGASLNGNALIVSDTPAALLSGANAAGLLLATATELSGNATISFSQATSLAALTNFTTDGHLVTIQDTAENLVLASTWSPGAASLLLAASQSVSAATLLGLTQLGSRFALGGYVLTVSDTAASLAALDDREIALTGAQALSQTATVGAAQAAELAALPNFLVGSFLLSVSDTAADVDAAITGLEALGVRLHAVTLTDTSSVSAAAAAGLVGIATKLTGAAISVADTAGAVSASLTALQTLGAHVSAVHVADTAAHVAAYATGPGALTGLGVLLSITLTDQSPVTAGAAAGLVPVQAYLLGSGEVNVSDTATAIAAEATVLAQLGGALGTVTVSGTMTVSAATAAAMLPLAGDFAAGTSFSVVDNAGAIAAVGATLILLRNDSRITSVTAAAQPVVSILAYGATLHSLGATATITDSAAAVNAGLDALEALTGVGGVLQSITLTDVSVPTLTVSVGQLSTDSAVLGLIGSSYHIAVSDTAADIKADLIQNGSSELALHHSLISSVVMSGGPIVLTDAQTLAAASTALALLPTAGLQVTGVAVADIAAIAGLSALSSMTVSDNATDIKADLIQNGSSELALHHGLIGSVTVSSGPIVLTDAQALAASSAALALLPTASLQVTGVAITDIATIAGLSALTSMTVSDNATDIANDLIQNGSSELALHHGLISSVVVSSGPIVLTDAQALAASSTALALLPSASLQVTGVAITNVATIAGLSALTSMTVSDSATDIANDLIQNGSSELALHHGLISSVLVSSGPVVLTYAQATAASATGLALLPSASLQVTGVAITNVATIANLAALSNMTVSDSATNIEADLIQNGSSELALHHSLIGNVIVSAGPIVLTDAQALAASSTALALLPTASLQVTGVAITDIATIAGLSALTSMTVSDSATDIKADLIQNGSSELALHHGLISSVVVGSAPIVLTDAQALAASSTALALLPSASLQVTGVAITDIATIAGLSALTSMTVSDNATDIANDLMQNGSSELALHHGLISSVVVSSGPVILTYSQVTAASATGLALLPSASLQVTGVAITNVATIANLASLTSMTVSDNATDIANDLIQNGSSELALHHSLISSVVVSSGPIVLTDAQALAASSTALALLPSASLQVTGVAVADIATIAGLSALSSMTVSDNATDIKADLIQNGSSELALHHNLIGSVVVSSGPIVLTDAQALAASSTALALLPSAGLQVTGVAITDIATITGLSALTSMTVSDNATDIKADLIQNGSSELALHHGLISSVVVSAGPIVLTDAQALAAASTALALLPSASLQVAGVAITDIAAIAGLSALTSMTVSDSATAIKADLIQNGSSELALHHGLISSVVVGSGPIVLTDAQALAAASTALALLPSASLQVTGVAITDIATIAGLSALSSMTVSDNATDIANDLMQNGSSELALHHGLISSVVVTSGPIVLTDAQALAASSTALALLPTASLQVTGVAITNVAAIAGLSALTSMTVSDNFTNIQTDLALMGSSVLEGAHLNITSIVWTDASNETLSLSLAELSPVSAAIGLINTTANGAGGIYSLTIDFSDTTANVQADLVSGSSVLEAHPGIAIVLTDVGTITLNVHQLSLATAAIAEISVGSPYTLVISDTAADVQADLIGGSSSILTNLAHVTSIVVSDGGTITLTEAQLLATHVDNNASSALAKTSGQAHLVVTGVAIADISGSLTGLYVAPDRIQISDTVAHIVSDIGGAHTITTTASITSVTPTDATITVGDATTIYVALTADSITFVESGLTITGTAAALLTAHTNHPAMLTAAAHVALSADDTGETAANATILAGISHFTLNNHVLGIADTIGNLLLSGNAAGIALATTVQLSGPTTTTAALATQLVALHGWTAGPAITIQDTYDQLLTAGYASGLAAATTVLLSANTSISGSQLAALALLNGFGRGGFSLTVTDAVATIIALSPSALNATTSIVAQGTSSLVQTDLDSLQTVANSHSLSIVLSDGVVASQTITVAVATYALDRAAIMAISTAGSVQVTGNAADLAAQASHLASDSQVGKVAVTDSVASILANLTTLQSIGSKFSQTTITDTSVNAAQVASLLTLTNLHVPGNFTILDTGSLIAAAIQANGTPGLNFMKSVTVDLSADSVIAASDAALLVQLTTSLYKSGFHLYVWDTASHLTDSADGYLAAVGNAIIDGVYLKTTAGSATITAATAATLLAIPNFLRSNPVSVGGTNTLIVSDTAAHLETNFTTLHSHASLLSSIVVSGNATITDAVFADMLTLAATTSASLTVRDTAANIYTNAPSQLAGSLHAAAWQLSGSASVTEAQAATLAGLTGFSAGAYTLTLSGGATVNYTAANALGTLGSSFSLGENQLLISGTVATLLNLTSAGKALVTPTINDTFANIAALSGASGILGGTINVSDSESVSYTTVENFLGLLKPDNASGAAVANVHFLGGTESVTDTLANIQSLTSYALWTDHVSMQANFTLNVADTVAVLTTAGNTAALAGMHSTTLNGSQSTTAASAEALFELTPTINFSAGTNQITILDSATNILNQTYSDGLASAVAWQLSGDATVVAADAETLLAASKFQVHGHVLTVADSSANLLDGVLSGDISGSTNHASVLVELAAPETLDAQTAHALVSLPGFTNNGDLSIADSSSYLLNVANLNAETDATSVTLAGNETVSAATAASLAALPHFSIGSNVLSLASPDYADASTLNAITGFGNFNYNSHTLTLTQDDLTATPTEYAAIEAELGTSVLNPNSHVLSAMPSGAGVSSAGGNVTFTATGVSGATLNVYAGTGGAALSTSVLGSSSINVTQSDASGTVHGAVVITETVGGTESAPIIALDATVVTTDAGAATFLTSGAVHVGTSANYMNVYTAGSQPLLTTPELVYDPTAHTVALDVNGTMTTLVTLGAATHPASLDPSEIFIKTFA